MANGRVPSTQNQLLVEFNALADFDGTVSMPNFETIAATPRFGLQIAKFEIGKIQEMRDTGMLPITNTPNIIVWNKFLRGPGIIGMHMNAIFDQRDFSGSYIVTCMEPFFQIQAVMVNGPVSSSIDPYRFS